MRYVEGANFLQRMDTDRGFEAHKESQIGSRLLNSFNNKGFVVADMGSWTNKSQELLGRGLNSARKKTTQVVLPVAAALALVASACGAEKYSDNEYTPTPTNTSAPTSTFTPRSEVTATVTETATPTLTETPSVSTELNLHGKYSSINEMPISQEKKAGLEELLEGFNIRINTGRVIVATEIGLEDRTHCPDPTIPDRVVLVPCPTIGDLVFNFEHYPDADKRLDELADHHLFFLWKANNPNSNMTFEEYVERIGKGEKFTMEMYGYEGRSNKLVSQKVESDYIMVYKFVNNRDRETLTPSTNGTNYYERTEGAVAVGIWAFDPAAATFNADTGVTTWIATSGIGLSDKFLLDRRYNGITGPVNPESTTIYWAKWEELKPVLKQLSDGTWEALITPEIINYPYKH